MQTRQAQSSTATVSGNEPDPDPTNDSDDESTDVDVELDLLISKVSEPVPVVPGETITYTIVVANAGPSDAVNAIVTDTLPSAIVSASWSCVPSGGASCGSGTGDINDVVSIPVGDVLTYEVVGLIGSSVTLSLIHI